MIKLFLGVAFPKGFPLCSSSKLDRLRVINAIQLLEFKSNFNGRAGLEGGECAVTAGTDRQTCTSRCSHNGASTNISTGRMSLSTRYFNWKVLLSDSNAILPIFQCASPGFQGFTHIYITPHTSPIPQRRHTKYCANKAIMENATLKRNIFNYNLLLKRTESKCFHQCHFLFEAVSSLRIAM